MKILRQSTSQTVLIGPFVDSTDGNTDETGLTINAADIRLSKNGANIVAKNSGGGTHDELGMYAITLDATDTNTIGVLQVIAHVTGALPVWHDFQVIEESAYDAIFASGAVGPLSAAAVNAEVDTAISDAALATAASITALNDLSAAQVNAECDTAIADAALATAANLATVDGNVDAILLDTAEIGAAGAGLTALATQASVDTVDANVDAILVDTSTTLEAHLTDIKGATFAGATDSLEAIRDRGDAAWITGGGGSAPTASEVADAVWDELQADHVTAGSFGEVATEVAAILVDTNELQTDDVPGLIAALNDLSAAQVNTEVDTAIADAALATAANLATVDANVDTILVDTGTTIPAQITGLNDLSAADVNAEVDTALADIHLDHLLAVDYDPATPPGVATALLNELIESDAGVSRFTINALENAPSGSGASAAAIADAVWTEALADHSGTAGSTAEALDAAGGSGASAAAIADAVWNELQADHVTVGSFGEIATEIASILADTNELQTDDVPGLIAALNDIAATDIVSNGAITTLAGAVVNVDLVDTTTTNSDMRGTDGANTAAPLDAAGIRTALGLASANLDTQLGDIDTVVDAILADTGTDGVQLSAATANQIADTLLTRDWTAVTGEAARSALNALRLLRNRYSISGTTLTVTEEDDATTAWTSQLTTDANADPVTASDPA